MLPQLASVFEKACVLRPWNAMNDLFNELPFAWVDLASEELLAFTTTHNSLQNRQSDERNLAASAHGDDGGILQEVVLHGVELLGGQPCAFIASTHCTEVASRHLLYSSHCDLLAESACSHSEESLLM